MGVPGSAQQGSASLGRGYLWISKDGLKYDKKEAPRTVMPGHARTSGAPTSQNHVAVT